MVNSIAAFTIVNCVIACVMVVLLDPLVSFLLRLVALGMLTLALFSLWDRSRRLVAHCATLLTPDHRYYAAASRSGTEVALS